MTTCVDTTIYSTQYSWNHVVSTYDGVSNKLYVNGILSNELPQFGYLTQNQNDLIFGGWFNYTGEECEFTKSFSGKLDDIGIWNRCLSEEEINKLPELKKDYITKNSRLYNKYKEEWDEWYIKHKEVLLKKEK